MDGIMSNGAASRHRVFPEIERRTSQVDRRMAKADLRISETRDFAASIGAVIQRAAASVGWNLDQLAGAINRDPRQVRRWIAGAERPGFDLLFAVPELRQPLVIGIAELAGHGVEIETVVRVKRIA